MANSATFILQRNFWVRCVLGVLVSIAPHWQKDPLLNE